MISYFAKKDKNLFIDFMFQNTCFVLFFVFLISFFRVLWNFQTDLKMFLISFAWHVIGSRMIWTHLKGFLEFILPNCDVIFRLIWNHSCLKLQCFTVSRSLALHFPGICSQCRARMLSTTLVFFKGSLAHKNCLVDESTRPRITIIVLVYMAIIWGMSWYIDLFHNQSLTNMDVNH